MPITTHIADRIAEIVFDVPPVNAFDSATWNALPAIIAAAGRNPDVNVVLIRAAEDARGFCGGVDIKEMQAHPERITLLNRGNYQTFKAVRECEVPVVTAVHRFVIGGGIGICGASDTIIAADDAYFSLPEVDRGAMGGASHLSRMLPLHKVRAAFFTGGIIPVEDAFRLGAVEKLVPRARLLAEARAFCATISGKSRKALVIAKEALNGLEPRDVDRGYRWEQGFTLEMYMHADSQKARDAFVATGTAAAF
ncbi:enoyl-CoA hydratase family protein [Sphingomonas sp. TDK1]|uniref:enoyl-CoA hydratase family protein n=1 Tax=Sphingomonas sp. TDK1 TaxID=453247 RepID=UPI0007DA084A|nr:enoyl-CoA hydratase family protein [Sphingomonas sp. TDK1]OAN66762.1 enoyl-CoA hydratase [Sphingomonas sp. TDK1]